MNEKVKLPKEVAEAIESLRNKGFANCNIFGATLSVHDHIDEVDVLCSYFNGNPEPYSRRSYDVLMEALVNGYIVEETPEDELRKKYRHLRRRIARYGLDIDKGEAKGMRRTLATLGIKIEGLNAPITIDKEA